MAVKIAFLTRWPLFFSSCDFLRSIAFTQRVTIPEIIFTAVEMAPKIIRMEMMGVKSLAPTPFCTRTNIGTEAVASFAT